MTRLSVSNDIHAPDTQRIALKSQRVVINQQITPAIIVIDGHTIEQVITGKALRDAADNLADILHDVGDKLIMPGLVDTHVHVNEPGRTDWEGFDTATHAAAAGGITTLVDMPLNCLPVTTSAEALQTKLDELHNKLWVDCAFWGGAIPQNTDHPAMLEQLLQAGVVGVKSFTIHSGIDEFPEVNESQMEAAMRVLARYDLPYLIHAELEHPTEKPDDFDPTSYQHFVDSRPCSWENNAIAMVIRVMEKLQQEDIAAKAHIVHLSSAEAIPMIADAQSRGLGLTAETCPHYLTLFAEEIPDGQPYYKCCPPIRGNDNRHQLWQGLKDQILNIVVSDHSPCTPHLKALEAGDLEQAWGGISGLQFGLPLIWDEGRKHGLTLTDLATLMCENPAEFIGAGHIKGKIAAGFQADIIVFDDTAQWTITPDIIQHKHKGTPYEGKTVMGKVIETWLSGQRVYSNHQDTPTFHGNARGKTLLKTYR